MPVSELVDDRSGKPEEIQANEIPKTNKEETTIERGDPLYSEIPEWLQEFRENWVDDEIPVHGDSHASSSREVSLEPTFKTREDLCKHSASLKIEIERSARGPKLQGPHAEDAMAEPYIVLKIFGALITADHKVLSDNCESRNNHRYAVVVQDLATEWIQAYP